MGGAVPHDPLPEPTVFLWGVSFPGIDHPPHGDAGAAMGGLEFVTADGLFRGPSPEFFSFMRGLAQAADAARR